LWVGTNVGGFCVFTGKDLSVYGGDGLTGEIVRFFEDGRLWW
jgi:hypothetical protein